MFSFRGREKSDEGAAREIVHHRADNRVGRDSLEQRRAAGDDGHADDQHGRDDRDDLLDAFLARADPGDVLADARAAAGAYAATLDDQVGAALGAFNFRPDRHDQTLRGAPAIGNQTLQSRIAISAAMLADRTLLV